MVRGAGMMANATEREGDNTWRPGCRVSTCKACLDSVLGRVNVPQRCRAEQESEAPACSHVLSALWRHHAWQGTPPQWAGFLVGAICRCVGQSRGEATWRNTCRIRKVVEPGQDGSSCNASDGAHSRMADHICANAQGMGPIAPPLATDCCSRYEAGAALRGAWFPGWRNCTAPYLISCLR